MPLSPLPPPGLIISSGSHLLINNFNTHETTKSAQVEPIRHRDNCQRLPLGHHRHPRLRARNAIINNYKPMDTKDTMILTSALACIIMLLITITKYN